MMDEVPMDVACPFLVSSRYVRRTAGRILLGSFPCLPGLEKKREDMLPQRDVINNSMLYRIGQKPDEFSSVFIVVRGDIYLFTEFPPI